jgi:hypothetical protein
VNPLYYVTFTTATLCASFILFGGFNTADAVNTLSLLSGFLVIFTGVYLLNLSRGDPDGHQLLNGHIQDGVATDLVSSIQTRRSMQSRRSLDHRLSINGSARNDRDGLIRAYDEEANGGFGLEDLGEEDSDEDAPLRGHLNGNTNGNGKIKRSLSGKSLRTSGLRSPGHRSPGPRSPR